MTMILIILYITPTSFPAEEKEKEKSNSAYYGHLHR